MGGKKRIVIAEDHRILREGLKSLLASKPEFEVVGEAEDGLDAISVVRGSKPDLILLDLSMPRLDGLSAMRDIKKISPETKILALTVHTDEDYVLEAFNEGADGYCLKDAGRAELLRAIESIFSGKPYFSPGIADKVLEGYLEGRQRIKSTSAWETITRREREVLKLIGEGFKNKEIADLLFISVKTVEKHRSNIMKKLDLHNAAALTAYAIEKGLVTY
ncbi:MAG: response regulator transcription factor [Deltaproteobacteria bacterium]|jgi:DNA-binding NarL/FixJ family response regulator|nr:response regulator transcription factor [Deltaproteobacteria bacterium]